MKISRVEYNNELQRKESVNAQLKREEDYRKVVEKRNIDRIIAEKIAKNRRLDKDKGRYIDIEV